MATGTTAVGAVSDDPSNHTRILRQLKETTEVAQRQRGNPQNSFVQLGELVNAGIIRYINGQVSAPTSTGLSGTGTSKDSIIGSGTTASPYTLANDSAAPGNNMYYGTNGSGVRGWFSSTSGGGSGTVTSVGLTSTGGDIAITGSSPITGAGTFDVELKTQSGITAGSYTNVNVTVNSKGIVTSITNGSGGSATPFSRGASWVSSSGAVTASPVGVPVVIPKACTLLEVIVVTAGGPGSATIKIWKAPIASYPPTGTGDITGGTNVVLSSASTYDNSTLSGWTTSFNQDDVLLFTLFSSSTFTLVSIQLRMQ